MSQVLRRRNGVGRYRAWTEKLVHGLNDQENNTLVEILLHVIVVDVKG